MSVSPSRARKIYFGLGLVLIAPFVPIRVIDGVLTERLNLPPHPAQFAVEAWMWFLALTIVVYVLLVERLPLSSIGLRAPTWMSLLFGFAGTVATMLLVGGLILNVLLPYLHLSAQSEGAQKLFALPYWQRFLIVCRAGIVEELLMRGYGIERVQELTGSSLVAGAVTLAVFTFGHLSYWNIGQLFVAGGAGLVLTVLYLWRRDLISNMISHFLTDGMSLLLTP